MVKGEKWKEAKEVCNRALTVDRESLEDGEEYHVLLARAKLSLAHENDPTAALADLNKAIEMKPALTGPYWLRSDANLKLGEFVAARNDLERFDESPKLHEALRNISRAEMEMRMAREAKIQKNWRGVGERTRSVLKNYSPHLEEARKLLSEAAVKLKDYSQGIKLLEGIETVDHFLMAKFYFATGDFKSALKHLSSKVTSESNDNETGRSDDRKALKEFIEEISSKIQEADNLLLRPSITALENLSKVIKEKYSKTSGLWDQDMPDLTEGAELKISSFLCTKYAKVKNSEKAIEVCKKVLNRDPKGFVDYSLSLAEAYGQLEQHDEAVKTLEAAANKRPRENRLKEALKAAQKARNDAANPDYYGLLGVPRDASDKQIKLAYRKLAQKYHPDKLKNATEEQRRAAELKMGQINRANDVLSDKEKRAQFDRGFDPENPQGNPFGQGGGAHHHGGGGFNFGHGGGGGGGVPFEFIFEAMRQAQGGGGGGGGGHRRQNNHNQQFHFNFKDDL